MLKFVLFMIDFRCWFGLHKRHLIDKALSGWETFFFALFYILTTFFVLCFLDSDQSIISILKNSLFLYIASLFWIQMLKHLLARSSYLQGYQFNEKENMGNILIGSLFLLRPFFIILLVPIVFFSLVKILPQIENPSEGIIILVEMCFFALLCIKKLRKLLLSFILMLLILFVFVSVVLYEKVFPGVVLFTIMFLLATLCISQLLLKIIAWQKKNVLSPEELNQIKYRVKQKVYVEYDYILTPYKKIIQYSFASFWFCALVLYVFNSVYLLVFGLVGFYLMVIASGHMPFSSRSGGNGSIKGGGGSFGGAGSTGRF